MKLFLIRHGETVDNVKQLLAGVTDSALTNHGFLQAEKLGRHLGQTCRITHIFSSDLQRAHITAKQVWSGQRRQHGKPVDALRIRKLPILRERDFGSYECMHQTTPYKAQGDQRIAQVQQTPGFHDVEPPASMARRMIAFLDDHLLPLILDPSADTSQTVAVVSHGMVLVQLWRCLLKRFALNSVALDPRCQLSLGVGFGLEKMASFSNTGYLNLSISRQATRAKSAGITEILASPSETTTEEILSAPSPTVLYDWMLVVHAINSREHLLGLKRTGGGVGSSRYDTNQKQIDSFFKK